ncbi:hypothetical protein [Mycolicibacterium obuense]|uniref:hypothetical protein n=1 Tax=Mycolicibacterium obuense TaxID=1807 RepID=UPI001F2A1CB1|nr:hypothetical protein [Mycolicibacterium obuense]
MPGRTQAEAVRNYIEPIQRAVSCLQGVGKIQRTGVPRHYGQFGAWVLNTPVSGMVLPGFGRLFASQRYELVQTTENEHSDPEREPFRVSTREYIYRLERDDPSWVMEWHWHPKGDSPERNPHIHPTVDPKAHLPCPRFAIEDVIGGCIALGASPSCDDWEQRLRDTLDVHKMFRTWE